MKPEVQAKTPLHLRLTTTDWVECFTQLTRAELGVLYYIRTRDPYGDRFLEIDCSQVGEQLGLHRTSVSRALEQLKHKGLIALEIQKARVSSRINNRRLTLLTQPENGENTTGLESCAPVQDLCADARVCAPTYSHVQLHTDSYLPQSNLCADAQAGASMHKDVRPCTHECTDARMCASMHEDIYIERAGDQTLQTYTDSFQTETDSTPTTFQIESVSVELKAEESSLSTLALMTFSNRARTSQPQISGQDKFSAAAIDPEILQVIETAVYDWRSRPWMATATTFKPEMVQAVWRCNPKWYSLEGSSTPNLKKISDRLRQLERQLKSLNSEAIAAWEELQNYWTCAQVIANPQVEQAFSKASTTAKRQQLCSLYAQALTQPTGGVF